MNFPVWLALLKNPFFLVVIIGAYAYVCSPILSDEVLVIIETEKHLDSKIPAIIWRKGNSVTDRFYLYRRKVIRNSESQKGYKEVIGEVAQTVRAQDS